MNPANILFGIIITFLLRIYFFQPRVCDGLHHLMQKFMDFNHVAVFTVKGTQPAQRRRKDVVETSYFWSQRRLRLVCNGSRDVFSRRRQDVFQETSYRPLPGDVLKTSSRRRP